MDRPRAAISWSGGKDGCTALQRGRCDFDVVAMITMLNDDGTRSRSHGLRPDVIAAQAERLGLAWLTGNCTWDSYTTEFCRVLGRLNNSPLFSSPLPIVAHGHVFRNGCWALDVSVTNLLGNEKEPYALG
jgi:diphthamide synthase (EF-2-diphthine--ammonia ligase)